MRECFFCVTRNVHTSSYLSTPHSNANLNVNANVNNTKIQPFPRQYIVHSSFYLYSNSEKIKNLNRNEFEKNSFNSNINEYKNYQNWIDNLCTDKIYKKANIKILELELDYKNEN